MMPFVKPSHTKSRIILLVLLMLCTMTRVGAVGVLWPDDERQFCQDEPDSVSTAGHIFIFQIHNAAIRLLGVQGANGGGQSPIIFSHTYRGPPTIS
jgi:hypothetical protein